MKIWIIRHAKSSWVNRGQTDFDRPLNHRGERDGPAMQDWLSKQDAPASWIWSSDALRALETSSFVRDAFGLTDTQVNTDHRLYLADPNMLSKVLRETPQDTASVALVAHNPGLTYLVNNLVATQITDNLPTFGVARLTYTGLWVDLEPGQATLDFLISPKTIDH